MGCTPNKPKGTKLPEYMQYKKIKEQVQDSPKYLFIKSFYQELYYTAENIIKLSAKYDNILENLRLTKQAIELFKNIDALQQIAQVLAIIPEVISPLIEQGRDPIIQSLHSARKFAEQYHDFYDDLYVLFKLLPSIETQKKVLDPKNRYKHGIHILKCLQNQMEAINEVGFEKQTLGPFKKIITLINAVRKITFLVGKLKKYLGFNVMGVSVLSILGAGGGGGMKGVIVKMALKGLCLPIKAAIKKLTAGNSKAYKYDFPMNFQKPESGWLGLKFGFDKASKKLDLFSCLPIQWAKNNLGNEYQEGAIKEYEPINRTQNKEDENEDEGSQPDFGEIKQGEDVKKDDEVDTGFTGNQNTVDQPKDTQDNNIKEVKNDVQNIVNQIQQSIHEIIQPDLQKQEIESQDDEDCSQIEDERPNVDSIPSQKRKMGVGSVLNKSFLLPK